MGETERGEVEDPGYKESQSNVYCMNSGFIDSLILAEDFAKSTGIRVAMLVAMYDDVFWSLGLCFCAHRPSGYKSDGDSCFHKCAACGFCAGWAHN